MVNVFRNQTFVQWKINNLVTSMKQRKLLRRNKTNEELLLLSVCLDTNFLPKILFTSKY